MGILFVWDNSYCTGNVEVDTQHRGLFELANSLTDLMTVDEMKQVAIKLLRYCRIHFSCEEAMMKEFDYPGLQDHQELHDNLEHRLADCMGAVFADGGDLLQLQKFIYDWLVEHILHQDKKFFDFVHGQKGNQNCGRLVSYDSY